jgi:hypothetical protein
MREPPGRGHRADSHQRLSQESSGRSGIFGYEGELGGHRDAVFDRAIDRTVVREDAVYAFRGLLLRTSGLERESNADSADHQDVSLQLHLADGLGGQTLIGSGDLARFQRASEGSSQSTRGCGNHIVEGGGMRLVRVRRHLVVLGDRSVNAEDDGLLLRGKKGSANRSLDPLDPDSRLVGDIGHASLIATGRLGGERISPLAANREYALRSAPVCPKPPS